MTIQKLAALSKSTLKFTVKFNCKGVNIKTNILKINAY